ncbi:GIY-YIG nuclease family protein [Salinicola endophyticus]|uniref:GIY-YIG nuclease family protein n=1 Tax=Salinicola endophyticus TaxID=1949083 RepID=A0ABY8FK71_9GAMM|nr:GIY-YIG nuclease family protein [Salinicola endophyticus]
MACSARCAAPSRAWIEGVAAVSECGREAGGADRPWYLYLIETAAGALYTGITTDVARRFAEHSRGKGARALRGRGPLTLRHVERVGSQSEALKREAAIKRLGAAQKRHWLAQRDNDCHRIVITPESPSP